MGYQAYIRHVIGRESGEMVKVEVIRSSYGYSRRPGRVYLLYQGREYGLYISRQAKRERRYVKGDIVDALFIPQYDVMVLNSAEWRNAYYMSYGAVIFGLGMLIWVMWKKNRIKAKV
ncbi:MAG: hypothetical protein HWE14_03335 [Flavobacteriia bacterium]|nr:hypothetical protein [Flavobacteriia bacterium]